MADQWYFAKGQNKFGPFTSVQMRELAVSGRLQPTDTVWKEGVETVVLASRVKNLFVGRVDAVPPEPPPQESAAAPETVSTKESHPSDADFLLSELAQANATGENESEQEAEAAAPAAEPPRTAPSPPKPPEQARKGTVMGATGAIVLGHDGRVVQFRKKCRNCGHVDTTRSTLPIRNGISRTNFFCPKCKKSSDVEIRGRM